MRDKRIPRAMAAVSAAAALALTLAAAPGSARAAAPPDGWAITLTATEAGLPERGQLTLGASSAASDGADAYDAPSPPLLPDAYLDLYTEHSRNEAGWGAQAAATLHYGAEYQSPLGAAERVVPFVVAKSHAGLFTLAWSGVSGPDLDHYNVLLEDSATGEQVDLRAESSHSFVGAPGTVSFRLHLVPGRGALTPPVVASGGDQSVTEGPGVGLNLGSFTDAGADGPWTADVDWGDGTPHLTQGVAAPGTLPSLAHGYADNGSYTVTVQVTDQAGAAGTASFQVAVANAPPSATFSAPAAVDAGSPITLSLTGAADPSPADTAAGFTYAFDCGDGSGYGSPGTANALSCPTTTAGTRTVKGKVLDKDGGATEYTASVIVNRVPVPPVAAFTLDVAAPAEGQNVTFTDTSVDSDGQVAGWTWDWGDGSAPVSGASSVTHRFPDNGTYTVTLTVTDNDGLSAQAQRQVTVANAPPSATFSAPAAVDAGSPITLSLTGAADPSPADTAAGFTYAFDCGDGSGYGSPGTANALSCPTTTAGTRTVKGRVLDKDGGATEYTASVIVNRVPVPPVAAFTMDLANPTEGQDVTFTDTSVDSDGQVAARTWDWGDGSAPVSGQSAVTHRFPDNGTYTVTLTVTDTDGLTAQAQHQVTVTNVAPALTAPPNQTATAGAAATFTMGAFSDPGADSPWHVVIDWGDSSPQTSLAVAAPGPLPPQVHIYAAAGNYQVGITVTDKDGASGFTGFTATVAPAGQCQPFTWLTPPDGATPYDVPVNSTLTLRFRWGDCTRFIHDESVIVEVENPNDPNYPITTWVYGYDITIDDAAEEYRVNFSPSLYGLAPGTTLPVTVYIGNQRVGQALIHLTP